MRCHELRRVRPRGPCRVGLSLCVVFVAGIVLTVGRYLTPTRVDIDRGGLAVDFGGVPGVGDADAVLAACRRAKR